jgi:hypothetical protein
MIRLLRWLREHQSALSGALHAAMNAAIRADQERQALLIGEMRLETSAPRIVTTDSLPTVCRPDQRRAIYPAIFRQN